MSAGGGLAPGRGSENGEQVEGGECGFKMRCEGAFFGQRVVEGSDEFSGEKWCRAGQKTNDFIASFWMRASLSGSPPVPALACGARDINKNVVRADFLENLSHTDSVTLLFVRPTSVLLDVDAWSLSPWSRQLCNAYSADNAQELMNAWAQKWEIKPAHDVVCRACGCGDNTMGHWTRWCVVLLLVAIGLPEPQECSCLCPYPGLL